MIELLSGKKIVIDMTELGNHYIAKYGRRVRINLALSAMVFIANAEDAEVIFQTASISFEFIF